MISPVAVSKTRVAEIKRDFGYSMQEAHRHALHETLSAALERAATVDELKPILASLIQWAHVDPKK